MNKIKKIIASAMAAMALATCVASISVNAVASTIGSTKGIIGPNPIRYTNNAAKATFMYNPGISATIQNDGIYSRYCAALIVVRRNIDGGFVTSFPSEGACGQGESVTATAYGYTGSNYKFTYSGTIHSGGAVQSPVDWTKSI